MKRRYLRWKISCQFHLCWLQRQFWAICLFWSHLHDTFPGPNNESQPLPVSWKTDLPKWDHPWQDRHAKIHNPCVRLKSGISFLLATTCPSKFLTEAEIKSGYKSLPGNISLLAPIVTTVKPPCFIVQEHHVICANDRVSESVIPKEAKHMQTGPTHRVSRLGADRGCWRCSVLLLGKVSQLWPSGFPAGMPPPVPTSHQVLNHHY